MKTTAILCSLLIGLLGVAAANDRADKDLIAQHGEQHTLQLIVSLTVEDDRGDPHHLEASEMAGLKVEYSDAHTEVVQISSAKKHKLKDGQVLVTVHVYTDAHDGKLALTVSHAGFETQTIPWALRAEGRPVFDLMQEPG